MASIVDTLTAARDNIAGVVANQTAAWLAAGCPPTFSIDGESYDWNNWLAGKLDAIERLNVQIQNVSDPFIVRSRVRA